MPDDRPPRPRPPFTVVVCTRNRADQLPPTLDRLAAQEPQVDVLVVDQSDEDDPELARRAAAGQVEVLRDRGRGLSRARNLAWPRVRTEWVVFVDDDCHVEPDWAARLAAALDRHPEAAFVSGHVGEEAPAEADGLVVSAFPVDREVVRRGARTWPWLIGFGVCMAVRRDWVERLGGWDERLGAGSAEFPAGEDMDFNHRLLREGGTAVAVPEVRSLHAQWRDRDALVRLFGGYATGWAAFSVKHWRTGPRLPALRFWLHGVYDPAKMVLSGLRRRSWLRVRVGVALLRGHAGGTARAWRTRW